MEKTVSVRGKQRTVHLDKQDGKKPSTYNASAQDGTNLGLVIGDGDDWRVTDAWGGTGSADTLEGAAVLLAEAHDRNRVLVKGPARRTAPRKGETTDPALAPPVMKITATARRPEDPAAGISTLDASVPDTSAAVARNTERSIGAAGGTGGVTNSAPSGSDGNAQAPGVGAPSGSASTGA